MTQDIARPPAPEPPGRNLVYVPVPAQDWRVAEEGTLCGYRRGGRAIGCEDPAVAEKQISATAVYPWRGYCRVHAASRLHWVQDGQVMTWDLRRQGREDVPMTVREIARAVGGAAGMCAQHHCPRAECPPESSHGHTIRFRDDLWQDTEKEAGGEGAVAAWVRQAMEVRLGYLRCDRGRCATDSPPVPVVWGDLTGMTLDEAIAHAAEQVRDAHPRHAPVTIGAVKP